MFFEGYSLVYTGGYKSSMLLSLFLQKQQDVLNKTVKNTWAVRINWYFNLKKKWLFFFKRSVCVYSGNSCFVYVFCSDDCGGAWPGTGKTLESRTSCEKANRGAQVPADQGQRGKGPSEHGPAHYRQVRGRHIYLGRLSSQTSTWIC